MDGTASSDLDEDSLRYSWSQIDDNQVVTLSDDTSDAPSFMAPHVDSPTDFVFKLVVNDGTFDSEPDTVTIAVSPGEHISRNTDTIDSNHQNEAANDLAPDINENSTGY